MIARAIVLAWLLLAGSASADGAHLSDLRWMGVKSTFPLFRAVSSGEFAGEVDARVAMRLDPTRYRQSLAFYRVAAALGSRLVPRTEAYAVRLAEVLAAAAGDSRGLLLLKEKEGMAIQNDGKVTVLVSEPIRGGREVDVSYGPDAATWRGWAEGRPTAPLEKRALVAAYVEMLLLDYLTANVGRRFVTVAPDAATLRLTENGGAFNVRVDPRAIDALLVQIKRVVGFPKSFMDRLRAFERTDADQALHAGGFASWLVASHPITEMMERRRVLLSIVDARTAEFGEASTFLFP